MIDFEKFKQVNDTHGHVVGDAILKQLGEIIRSSVRKNDLIFRYGGEEFAEILPDTSEKGARYVAERIRSTTEATSIHDLIVVADQALHAAKRQGHNQVVLADVTHKESRREQVQLKESS